MANAEEILSFDLGVLRPKGGVYDIAFGDGKVYVPDLTNNIVVVLDDNLKLLSTWKNIPTPHGLSVDRDGAVYVGTHRSGRIRKYDAEGNEVSDWDVKLQRDERIKAPVTVTVSSENTLYVCDWILQRVIEISANGELIRLFEDREIKKGKHFQPHGVAVDDRNRRIYVADRGSDDGNGVIQVFDKDGRYLGHWEKPAPDFDPMAIKPLKDRLYIVPSYGSGAFFIFNDEGRLMQRVEAYGEAPGRFLFATSVATDEKGYLYVPELSGNRIQKVDFRPVIEENTKKLLEKDR